MTSQEQQMIQSLADRINNTPLAEKDPSAEQFLQQVLGGNPDALYILAQTTLVQQYALEQAQKQLTDTRAQLEQQRQQAQQPRHATSFLGNLLGGHDEPAPSPPPPQYAPPSGFGQSARSYSSGGSSFSGPGYVPPPPPYSQAQYAQPQYSQPQSGSFLRSAAQTAAGVAAGALAFEGIESLMHGFGGAGRSGFDSGMGGSRPEEIINNNYYGNDGPSDHRDLSSDIEDRRDERGSFEDAVDHGDHNYGNDDLLDPTGSDDPNDSSEDSSLDDDSGSDDFASSDDTDNS